MCCASADCLLAGLIILSLISIQADGGSLFYLLVIDMQNGMEGQRVGKGNKARHKHCYLCFTDNAFPLISQQIDVINQCLSLWPQCRNVSESKMLMYIMCA